MELEPDPRLTLASLKVLQVFLGKPAQSLSGADVCKLCDVQPGTVYPILTRFVSSGWMRSKWEGGDPKKLRRPRKCLYWLTPTGRVRALAALASLANPV